jgi:hypothetical protein
VTTQRTGSRFGPVGKTVGGILAGVTGLTGAWGWFYLLTVSVQGPGGISDIAMPFFTIGLVIWVIFWGLALTLVSFFFGRKSRTALVSLSITGLMVVVAVVTPIVAGIL